MSSKNKTLTSMQTVVGSYDDKTKVEFEVSAIDDHYFELSSNMTKLSNQQREILFMQIRDEAIDDLHAIVLEPAKAIAFYDMLTPTIERWKTEIAEQNFDADAVSEMLDNLAILREHEQDFESAEDADNND